MQKTFPLLAAAALATFALHAKAEVLTLPGIEDADAPPAEAAPGQPLPDRGMSQTAVLDGFGAPQRRHPPAGGEHPQHPPITRWDYDGYSVFFENNTVIDVVVEGRPAPLQHVDELKAAP